MIDSAEVIAQLRASDARSGGRREAWTREWVQEREEHTRLLPAGVRVESDAFANRWYLLPGESEETVLVHSHSDAVPGGGWLDGILGLHAGLGLLRSLAAETTATGAPPRRTLAVVDWADEEGTRFGRSLLGSAAATSGLPREELEALRSGSGEPALEVVRGFGCDPDALGTPSPRLARVVAALELHIEQGPVLESQGRACAAVAGALGVRRHRITFPGESGHAGSLPMALRRDPMRAAARFITAICAEAEAADGLATVGSLRADPGVATIVPAAVELSLDVRHAELAPLEALQARTLALAEAAPSGTARLDPLFRADPVRFDADLVARAIEQCGGGEALISGPLHDSVNLARHGIPAAMLFVASRGGISHSRAEDSSEADLRAGIEALAGLATALLDA